MNPNDNDLRWLAIFCFEIECRTMEIGFIRFKQSKWAESSLLNFVSGQTWAGRVMVDGCGLEIREMVSHEFLPII